jgi:hypothetical protein
VLDFNGMGRRTKSNEAAYFDAITGTIGLGVLLWLFSPGFRYWMQIILLLLVAISMLLSDESKFCPKSESEMVLRTARVTGNQFWGCSKTHGARAW